MHSHHSPYTLQLTPNALDRLQRLIQAHGTPQAVARRAQLILFWHTHPDWGAKRRHMRCIDPLAGFASGDDAGTKPTLSKMRARSGAPRRFSPDVRAQVTALACSLPRSHGIPLSRNSASRTRSSHGSYSFHANSLSQYHWPLAYSRKDSSLALPQLAAYPETR